MFDIQQISNFGRAFLVTPCLFNFVSTFDQKSQTEYFYILETTRKLLKEQNLLKNNGIFNLHAIRVRFNVDGQEGDSDSIAPRDPDDPLAVEVVLVGLRMLRRTELAGSGSQEAAAAGDSFKVNFQKS
jgi:hypothetical protein